MSESFSRFYLCGLVPILFFVVYCFCRCCISQPHVDLFFVQKNLIFGFFPLNYTLLLLSTHLGFTLYLLEISSFVSACSRFTKSKKSSITSVCHPFVNAGPGLLMYMQAKALPYSRMAKLVLHQLHDLQDQLRSEYINPDSFMMVNKFQTLVNTDSSNRLSLIVTYLGEHRNRTYWLLISFGVRVQWLMHMIDHKFCRMVMPSAPMHHGI